MMDAGSQASSRSQRQELRSTMLLEPLLRPVQWRYGGEGEGRREGEKVRRRSLDGLMRRHASTSGIRSRAPS